MGNSGRAREYAFPKAATFPAAGMWVCTLKGVLKRRLKIPKFPATIPPKNPYKNASPCETSKPAKCPAPLSSPSSWLWPCSRSPPPSPLCRRSLFAQLLPSAALPCAPLPPMRRRLAARLLLPPSRARLPRTTTSRSSPPRDHPRLARAAAPSMSALFASLKCSLIRRSVRVEP